MKANWYYIENDETVGPTTLEDLARRIGQTGETLLVWTQGMTEWTDAEAIPTLSQLVRSRSPLSAAAPETSIAAETVIGGKATLGKRLRNELSEYFVISGYLFICFGALLFYKAAILHSDGIDFAPFGIAIVKALVLAKFVLLLHALQIGERKGGGSVLVTDILKKSVLFLIFLVALTVVEEIIVGFIHGRSVAQAIGEIGGGTLQQALATSILMLLILIPYFTFRLVSERLGEGALWKLLTQRTSVVAP
jgi:uncharacterized protein DUF4339